MVVFGGFSNGIRTNDIHRFFFNENQWEQVKPMSHAVPSPRAGHSAVLYQDQMIVFGGKDEENNKLNDVWVFDFVTSKWGEV